MIKGRCECGSIRYASDGPVMDFGHCHCSMCRRLHGAGFVSFAGVTEKSFQWLSDTDTLKIYASSKKNDRYFCSQCGSQILVKSNTEPDMIYLAMGTLDDEPELPAGYHQFADSKVSWIDVRDDLPRFPGPVER